MSIFTEFMFFDVFCLKTMILRDPYSKNRMVESGVSFDFRCFSAIDFCEKMAFNGSLPMKEHFYRIHVFDVFCPKTMILRVPYSKNRMVESGVFFDFRCFSAVDFYEKNDF